jgi:GTP cyclohydrolase IA
MTEIIRLTNKAVESAAQSCAARVSMAIQQRGMGIAMLFGVPRGGIPAAYLVRNAMTEMIAARIVDDLEDANAIIDDIVDSGKTRARYKIEAPSAVFDSLFTKQRHPTWFIFPWEDSLESSAEDIVTRLLQFIGEDPTREGLRETPRRFLAAWQEYTRGYAVKPQEVLKVFEDGADGVDELVIVRDLQVYSTCEHHLAPFVGRAHIGYIPKGKILGLSKFARLVEVFARRLQVQERMTTQIADALCDHLQPLGVGVVLECRHMCMEARGAKAQGSVTTTSAMRGVLRTDASARAEFLRLVSAPRSVAV